MGYENHEEKKYHITVRGCTYQFTMKVSRAGSKYLEIAEIKRLANNAVERSKIVIFEEGFEIISNALTKIISGLSPTEVVMALSEPKANYENAGKPWTPEDDSQLTQLYKQRKNIHELSWIFKRSKTSITSRLEKLGLIL